MAPLPKGLETGGITPHTGDGSLSKAKGGGIEMVTVSSFIGYLYTSSLFESVYTFVYHV